MSLKCSVFGHRFGDTDVEREREEQGSEVVITITETEQCERCGETRVVSENKEVTTMETPSDIVGDDVGSEPADGDDKPGTDSAGAVPGGSGRADDDSVPADGAASGTAMTDDAELVDEAEGDGERPRPAAAGTADDGSGDVAGGGMPSDAAASAAEDDAVILDSEDEEDDEREPGQWPQETDDEPGDDWDPDLAEGELRPVEEDQPDVEPIAEAVTVPEGEFHCPECGFTTPVESSSLRAGDFCPECHRGTLVHRSES